MEGHMFLLPDVGRREPAELNTGRGAFGGGGNITRSRAEVGLAGGPNLALTWVVPRQTAPPPISDRYDGHGP